MSEELFRNRLTLNARKGMFRTLSNNQGHLKQTFGPYPLSELISFSQSSIAVEFKKGEKPSIMLKLFFSTAKWCKHRLNRRVIKYGQIEVLLSTIWIFMKINAIGTKTRAQVVVSWCLMSGRNLPNRCKTDYPVWLCGSHMCFFSVVLITECTGTNH